MSEDVDIVPRRKPQRRNPLARTWRASVPAQTRSRTAQGLTRAAAEGRFALQRCDACKAFVYPPRDACPSCLGATLSFTDAPRDGVILSETNVQVSGEIYFRERTPWRIGLVKLDCGPIMVAHLHRDCVEDGRVYMSLALDKGGRGVAFARPAGPDGIAKGPPMADDTHGREMTADPRTRRILITDGRTAIGQALVRALRQAGAGTIFVGVAEAWKPFAGASTLQSIEDVVLVPLDVTDERSVAHLAADIGAKVDILINTTEHIRPGGLLDRRDAAIARLEIDVGYLGMTRLAQAFGPIMRARGADRPTSAAAWINLLSVYALANWPAYGAYAAGQAACLSLSHCLRAELRPAGLRVLNIFSGPLDTEWFQTVPPPKVAPAALAKAVVAALSEGVEDVFVGDVAEDIRIRLAMDAKAVERELSE